MGGGFRGPKSEIGNPEIGNRKSEIGNPEIGNRKSNGFCGKKVKNREEAPISDSESVLPKKGEKAGEQRTKLYPSYGVFRLYMSIYSHI